MFENIIGHDKQKELLTRNLENNAISHSYLFLGDEGIGKFKLACEFSKLLLNTDNLDNNPDFKIISKKENKKDILVEQIRKDIIDDIYIAPATGARKVYIINNADELNKTAQNTLLKTLEEPPKYITLILIASSSGNFLPTILSRVNEIKFDGISNELLDKYIKDEYNIALDKNIIQYINGSLGKAINIVQNNLLEKYQDINKLQDYIISSDTINALLFCDKIDFNNVDSLDYLEFIMYNSNQYNCVEIIENAKNRLKSNGNYDIITSTMLLKLIDSIKGD